jgi:RNA polymerase sigma-70 factor (ECF subfamily)
MKSGDARALELFYARHAGAVLALCRRILGDSGEAEEATLDSFVQVWDRAASYDPRRASPVAYLMAVARSRAIDRLRARARRPHPIDWAGEAPAPTGTPDALDETLLAERRERMRAALGALAERERHLVELSFYQGLSHREITERLGIPLGTVKTRIRQGLLRLRDRLRSAEPGGERP